MSAGEGMKLAEDLRRSVLQAAIEGKLTGGSRENWRFMRLGEISLSVQYGYNVPYCEISEDEMQKYLLAKNDILFARTGSVGKSYLCRMFDTCKN